MQHADYKKTGVVYGYQSVGCVRDLSVYVYSFGRSERAALRTADTSDEKKRALRPKGKGLNRCREIVYWVHSADLETDWDLLKQRLRGGVEPRVLHLEAIGANWFASDLPPAEFTRWLQAPVDVPRVQFAGDEVLIGPVSSTFAARAVLGLI